MCGKEKRNVSLEPSRSTLLFGGFPQQYERRCPACERKVVRQFEEILNKDVSNVD